MWMWAELKADEPKLVIRERDIYIYYPQMT